MNGTEKVVAKGRLDKKRFVSDGPLLDSEVADVIDGQRRWALAEGEAVSVLRALPAASIDAVITDPPYSSGGSQSAGRTVQPPSKKYGLSNGDGHKRPDFHGDNRDQRSFLRWCSLWLSECLRASASGAPVVVFTDWRQLPTVTDALQIAGWVWRGIAVWDKTEGARPQMGRFRSQCEYMVWGTNGPSDRAIDNAVGVLPGCFRHFVKKVDRFHVTGKPTPLMEDVVKICRPKGVVLDPFAGSGTTLVAALAQGRRAIGCELSDEYAEIARGRCSSAAAATSTKV
ncbi:MAG: site-specific DNA-methyltransferase [Deltaproteobacteria bacterium]|nr:site-specific DNA-methyltransferase [Deltaproteobacteria bacterium]